jgi:Raf kinase inhibitor-like YbhB/YbcL family protein
VLSSSAFKPGQPIPRRHTEDGEDLSPALAWSGAPQGVKEFALICDDPDAPTAQPWVHWVIYRLSPDLTGLPEGVPQVAKLDKPAGAMQGLNGWPGRDNLGYRGPAPPPGKVHHYYFKLYALDRPLTLAPGASKTDLLRAIDGHMLGTAELVGTYKR